MADKPKASLPVSWTALASLAAVLILATIGCVFFFAPVEERMGIVQKIFYFHVPSAYAMYIGIGCAAVGSAGYLIKRKPGWDALGVAGAEVGLVFAMIVLITGPLWARKSWGVWWTWDPRLTTTLLAACVLGAYVALRSTGNAGEAEKRFASTLAVFGVLIVPIIHYSVQKWRGQHPTVITNKGGGLHPDMRTTLIASFVAFTALVAIMIWTRYRLERDREQVRELRFSAMQNGMLEDEA